MIPLVIPAISEASGRFVTRLTSGDEVDEGESRLIEKDGRSWLFSGVRGLFSIATDEPVIGDVICVDPDRSSAERLIRANSPHNTFLITEQCDQLCIMCSQPPKKQHEERFAEYRQAMLLAPEGAVIGLSGGEPTLHKEALFAFLDEARTARPDLFFHILSNGQHLEADDVDTIRAFKDNTLWGIPLYSHNPLTHDQIVTKDGAYARLMNSLVHCLTGGMHIELRTVILQTNFQDLVGIARLVAEHLGFISQWSIMQLENIGFAKNRFDQLYIDHSTDFGPLAEAVDIATLFGVPVRLFNMPLCSVPAPYRRFAVNSISDWKQKYAPACAGCSEQAACPGFFAWHPDTHMKVSSL